ncbi:hypothetical protein DFJ74DRAFT_456354 [Hyaloraphidium curvatum]|nr:hypothetical protein DFJ74DRAFT_456354 [Hyaloraphidium curvatum]
MPDGEGSVASIPVPPMPAGLKLKDPAAPSATLPSSDLPKLFQPLKIRGVELKNRIAVSPMCEYSAKDGMMNSFHLVHLAQYAIRGCGLVIFEASGVMPNGRITPHCPGIWSDDHIAPMKAINDLCHLHNAKTALQIAHAGRKASSLSPFHGVGHDVLADESQGGWPTNVYGPSAIKNSETQALPIEVSKEQIMEVVKAFGEAAVRADKADFDALEVHAAHGYLIHSFYSPISNKRTDEFGGSFENRTRLAVLVAREVRKNWPATKPLFMRISATDWVDDEPSWRVEDSVKLAELLAAEGVDLIDCSSSGVATHKQKIPWMEPCYNTPLAETIKKALGDKILVGAVGNITTATEAEAILEEGKADLILLGRVLLRDPNWAVNAATELGLQPEWASQYDWSKPAAPRGIKRH